MTAVSMTHEKEESRVGDCQHEYNLLHAYSIVGRQGTDRGGILFQEGGAERCHVLMRVLMEICIFQIATSSSGIRRGRQVCTAICASEGRQCVRQLEGPALR